MSIQQFLRTGAGIATLSGAGAVGAGLGLAAGLFGTSSSRRLKNARDASMQSARERFDPSIAQPLHQQGQKMAVEGLGRMEDIARERTVASLFRESPQPMGSSARDLAMRQQQSDMGRQALAQFEGQLTQADIARRQEGEMMAAQAESQMRDIRAQRESSIQNIESMYQAERGARRDRLTGALLGMGGQLLATGLMGMGGTEDPTIPSRDFEGIGDAPTLPDYGAIMGEGFEQSIQDVGDISDTMMPELGFTPYEMMFEGRLDLPETPTTPQQHHSVSTGVMGHTPSEPETVDEYDEYLRETGESIMGTQVRYPWDNTVSLKQGAINFWNWGNPTEEQRREAFQARQGTTTQEGQRPDYSGSMAMVPTFRDQMQDTTEGMMAFDPQSDDVQNVFRSIESEFPNLPPNILSGIMMTETSGRPEFAMDYHYGEDTGQTAFGMFGITRPTAADAGFGIPSLIADTTQSLRDVSWEDQARFTAQYLSALIEREGGNVERALDRYGTGIGTGYSGRVLGFLNQ